MAWMDYMDPDVCCPQKDVKLTHSITHSITQSLKFKSKCKHFIHENAFENVVCKVSAILSRGRWVNFVIPDPTIYVMHPLQQGLIWHCWICINNQRTPVLTNMLIISIPSQLSGYTCCLMGPHCNWITSCMKYFCTLKLQERPSIYHCYCISLWN